MKIEKRHYIFGIVVLLANIISGTIISSVNARPLIFGRVHDDPVRSIRDRQEFVDYFSNKLKAEGIEGGRIVVVEKMSQLAEALREGKIDIFHDSVVPVMVMSKQVGAVPILRQWKYGEPDYEGVIVVRKDSGINALKDLYGKVIAFEEPHSTSASVLPRMLFAEKKLKAVQVRSKADAKPGQIGFFHGNDGNSINLLVTDRSDASVSTLREIDRLKPEVREKLKILAKTDSVPRQLIAVRKDLDVNLIKAIKQVLIRMDESAEGRGVLTRQQNTSKIDEIPEGSLKQLKHIEDFVYSTLGKEIDSW